jgi:hypothetical protein
MNYLTVDIVNRRLVAIGKKPELVGTAIVEYAGEISADMAENPYNYYYNAHTSSVLPMTSEYYGEAFTFKRGLTHCLMTKLHDLNPLKKYRFQEVAFWHLYQDSKSFAKAGFVASPDIQIHVEWPWLYQVATAQDKSMKATAEKTLEMYPPLQATMLHLHAKKLEIEAKIEALNSRSEGESIWHEIQNIRAID